MYIFEKRLTIILLVGPVVAGVSLTWGRKGTAPSICTLT